MGRRLKKKKHQAYETHKLKPVTLKKLKAGRHGDGGGLYLDVKPSGSRSWILRTMVQGKRSDIGLGSLSVRTLAEARQRAAELRARARQGEDIVRKKQVEKQKAKTPTFEQAAAMVHREVVPTLKSEHTKVAWLRSLELHAFPVFGSKTVDAVDSADVLKAIGPLWATKPDMARKTLTRIRRVMDWATINYYRNVIAGDSVLPQPNPCVGIKVALPKQPKTSNHAALPYVEVPPFLQKLRRSTESILVKLAMEFTILTVVRTSEAIDAEWVEVNLEEKLWSIPVVRMKMDEPHLVPLSDRAMEILEETKTTRDGGKMIFPSSKKGVPLSNAAMLRALQRMEGYQDMTVHGFRASFKTWARERTRYDSLVIEAALAHQVGGIERHYLRTTFLDERRKLLQDWARFVTGTGTAKVVSIGTRG